MKLIKSSFKRISTDLRHKELFPLKVLFFVHASTLFVLYPYLTIHMRELGINVEETAIMSAITPVVSIVMPPVAGMIADKIGNFKLLLAISSAMGGLAALLLLAVPVGRVTVTYPPRAELSVGCGSPGILNLETIQHHCVPLHPYSYYIDMKMESCGVVCDWFPQGHAPPLSQVSSYSVKIEDPESRETEVHRFPVRSKDLPPSSMIVDRSNARTLTNDENYNTSIRMVSSSSIFFPSSEMYNFGCSSNFSKSSCDFRFSSEEEQLKNFPVKIVPGKDLYWNNVLALSPKHYNQSLQSFNLEGISKFPTSLANFTSKDLLDLNYTETTCSDAFSDASKAISVEILLRKQREASNSSASGLGISLVLSGCSAKCLASTSRSDLCANDKEEVEIDVNLTFWTYLAVRVFIGIISGTAFAMFEGAVIAILREHNADYGLQRIYGSIGGMISSPLSGLMIDYASKGKGYTDFRPAFYLYAVLKLVSGFLMMSINLEFKSPASNLFDDVCMVMKNIELLALLLACFVLGTAWGYIESFLFWLLQDLGGSRSLMGITITVGGIGGLPLLALSGPIIRKLGHANVLFIGFIFYAIRLFGYSIIYNPWMCLIFEALEGVTSSLTFTAAVTYAARLSTTTTDTSVQGLLGGIYYGVGKGCGSLIGGYLMKGFGTRPTYRIFACATLIIGCGYYIFNRFYLSKLPKTEGNDIVKKVPKIKDSEKPDKVLSIKSSNEKIPLKDSIASKTAYMENSTLALKDQDKVIFCIDPTKSILDKEEPVCMGIDNPTFTDADEKSRKRSVEMKKVDGNSEKSS